MSQEVAFEVGRLYEPIREIADILSLGAGDPFINLPGLLAAWPGGIRGGSGSVIPEPGTGLSLSMTGTVPTGLDVTPYVSTGTGTNYLSSTNTAFAITGTETWIESSIRGLTLGGWVNLTSLPLLAVGVMSKFAVVGNFGYVLGIGTGGPPFFQLSSDGTALATVNGATFGVAKWTFLVGRFTPSVELALFVNGVKTTLTAGVPASIFPSTQSFEVGRYANNNGRIVDARLRNFFVCASALSDDQIEGVRTISQP